MMADTSLWPVVVGGVLALGGTVAGAIATTIRDAAQQRHERKKRRADKFEELVAAVYEFDHWLDSMRGHGGPKTVSPFSKVQSIAAVYFPQFSELISELNGASRQYRIWIVEAWAKGVPELPTTEFITERLDRYDELHEPYAQKRDALLAALAKFAREEFQ
jgi:hypothetical protein